MHTYPLTEVEPVVTNAELAYWLGVDATDRLLPIFAIAATSAAIEYLQSELISRTRRVVHQEWPGIGTDTSPTISRNNINSMRYIDLPCSRLISVQSVLIGGVATTDYKQVDNLPAQLYFDTYAAIYEKGDPVLVVDYTAGYGDINAVPQAIKSAVSMMAAYMYEHRGACDATNALDQSGAAMALEPYKTFTVMM